MDTIKENEPMDTVTDVDAVAAGGYCMACFLFKIVKNDSRKHPKYCRYGCLLYNYLNNRF